jgi:hypothetical protein
VLPSGQHRSFSGTLNGNPAMNHPIFAALPDAKTERLNPTPAEKTL